MDLRPRVAIPAALIIVALIGFYGSFYAFSVPIHPCHESFAADHPSVAFEFDRPNAETVTITHAGGDTIKPAETQALVVLFTDSETGTGTRIVWANDSTGTQVSYGDNFTLHQKELRAASISNGDRIRVVWQERETDIPVVCPNYAPVETATLGDHTLTNETSHRAVIGEAPLST